MYAVFGQTVLNQSEIKNRGSFSLRWMLVILLFNKNASDCLHWKKSALLLLNVNFVTVLSMLS